MDFFITFKDKHLSYLFFISYQLTHFYNFFCCNRQTIIQKFIHPSIHSSCYRHKHKCDWKALMCNWMKIIIMWMMLQLMYCEIIMFFYISLCWIYEIVCHFCSFFFVIINRHYLSWRADYAAYIMAWFFIHYFIFLLRLIDNDCRIVKSQL